jgi:hypothetical protein
MQQPRNNPAPSGAKEPDTLAYSLVPDTTYDGVKFFDQSATPYNAYPELDGWVSAPPNPVGNGYGSMQVYRRTTDGGREDLLVTYTGPDRAGADGLRLTGDTRNVYLVLSCSAEAAVLMPGSTMIPVGDLDRALRAWRPAEDGTLEEFDPSSGETVASC